MKTRHQNEDIDNYFLRIKTESVFKVLKHEEYKGIKRTDTPKPKLQNHIKIEQIIKK